MVKIIIGLFLFWRGALFLVSFLAGLVIVNFGARFPYYEEVLESTGLPAWIWGFGNFDGVHYLRIVLNGYNSEFTQAFFPLYSILLRIFYFGHHLFETALILSSAIFLISLYVFYKLIRFDYSHRIAIRSVILLLAFPTSFYFGAVYSEGTFFLFALLTLVLLRKKYYLLAGICGGLASATRIFGLLLSVVFLIEIFISLRNKDLELWKKPFFEAVLGFILTTMGTVCYMVYLKLNFNDPLYFLSAQPAFGAARSSLPIILLPQVLFRYFKMIISLPVYSLSFFNTMIELLFTLLPLSILIMAYKKMRFSYWIFTLGCLILPTLTGTLSSMPRYALTSFLLFPFVVEKVGKYFFALVSLMVVLEAILLSLFVRGYWVA